MLDVAIEAAKAGGQVAYSYFKNIPKVSYKADNSPVTKADIEAEKAIRKVITKGFPDHEIIGEESGQSKKKSKYTWVIDPIDGTRSYIRGISQWCVLVAVLEDSKPIIGVCYYPNQEELFSARKGSGTFLNGKKTIVSNVKNLDKAYIAYYNLKHFARLNKAQNLLDICQQTYYSTNIASYSLGYLLQGKIDAYICAHGLIWDLAAPAILVEEAGGKFTDFDGRFSLTSDTGIFSNGFVHKQVLKLLNS